MPVYELVLNSVDGTDPEVVTRYDSEVSFGPGMTLPPRQGKVWLVDQVSASGLTLYCKPAAAR